ncbi:MAG: hypothetical protein HETSPECPRED_007247 [Heterodermia speciosa]|uniref:Zn(2)-C6 fungal-type domain-containing protein n=1 Tax=Heterodermia speciosa TaxID=116794 RepID=A0A8H3IVX7_9LECA|nr:MAG: hypothetical protein HETSPECPRED_007247 [Heterodermia speciosa]
MDLQSHVEPDTSKTNTTTAATRPTKSWKLRQTCDLCSEAKVKCDKGNPRCGRCDRLSYECVYSPARRIGRPRPRSPRSQDSGRPARDEVTTDEASKSCTAPPPLAQQAELTPTARYQGFADSLHEPLAECFSDDASASSNARSHNASLSTSIRDGLLSSLEQPSLSIHEARHTPYEYDCATVAVATLRKLAATGLEGWSASQPTAAVDVLADLIPQACKEAARILVCPCSAEMDMALLAASLAAAILEVADAALRALKPAGHSPDDGQRTVLALGTLPKISQVVTLFTHRYSVTQASRPPESLLLLAASLRTTLKAMAEETTNRFLDGGAGHTRVEVAA